MVARKGFTRQAVRALHSRRTARRCSSRQERHRHSAFQLRRNSSGLRGFRHLGVAGAGSAGGAVCALLHFTRPCPTHTRRGRAAPFAGASSNRKHQHLQRRAFPECVRACVGRPGRSPHSVVGACLPLCASAPGRISSCGTLSHTPTHTISLSLTPLNRHATKKPQDDNTGASPHQAFLPGPDFPALGRRALLHLGGVPAVVSA